jgi:hypothetical protein
MKTFTKKEVLEMTAIIVAGIFSNPGIGGIVNHQYDRQQMICQTINDVEAALYQVGYSLDVEAD